MSGVYDPPYPIPYNPIRGTTSAPPILRIPVQDASSVSANAPTNSATLANTPTKGNVLLCWLGNNSSYTVSSIVQTGVVWNRLVQNNAIPDLELWLGIVGEGATSTVDVTWSGTDFNALHVSEWSNLLGNLVQSILTPPGTTVYSTSVIHPQVPSSITSGVIVTSDGATPFNPVATGPMGMYSFPAFWSQSGNSDAIGVIIAGWGGIGLLGSGPSGGSQAALIVEII